MATGTITTVAGTGEKGFGGDGAAAKTATLNDPFFCVFDRDANLYIADMGNHAIRVVSKKDSTIRTLAGNGTAGFAGDGETGARVQLHDPVSLALDAFDNLFVCERIGKRIRKITRRSGTVSTFLALPDFKDPHDIVFDGAGNLLLADVGLNKAFRIDPLTRKAQEWLPSSPLKPGFVPYSDKQTNTNFSGEAQRRQPVALAISFNFTNFKGIRALAVGSGGVVYVVERAGQVVRRVNLKSGDVDLIAGTSGQKGYAGDSGDAKKALLNGPKGVFCDAANNLFIVDTENHAIRRVDGRTGVITTVAGTGEKGSDGDGGPANKARLNRPHGCIVGPDGALYIADSENHRIRRVEIGS